MIEEAAGVRLYETKKLSAIKTIEKKEGKVAEISQVFLLSSTSFIFVFYFSLWINIFYHALKN